MNIKPISKSSSKSMGIKNISNKKSPMTLRNQTISQEAKAGKKKYEKQLAVWPETAHNLAISEKVPQSPTFGGKNTKRKLSNDGSLQELKKQKLNFNKVTTEKDRLAKAKDKLDSLVRKLTNDKETLKREKAQLNETVKSLRIEIEAQREAQNEIDVTYDNYDNNSEMDIEPPKDVDSRNKQREDLDTTLSSLETEAENLQDSQTKLDEAIEENKQLTILVKKLKDQVQEQSREADDQESHSEMIRGEIRNLNNEIASLKEQQNQHIELINKKQAIIDRHEEIGDNVDNALLDFYQEINTLKEQEKKLNAVIEEKQAIIDEHDNQMDVIDNLEANIKSLKDQQNEQNELIYQLKEAQKQDLINAEDAAKKSTQYINELIANLEQNNVDITSLQEKLKVANEESNKRQTLINQKEQEIGGLKIQIENLEATPKRKFVRAMKQLPKPVQGAVATFTTGIATAGGYLAGSTLSNPWVETMNYVGHQLFSGDHLPTLGEKIIHQAIELAPYAPYAVGGAFGILAGGFMFSELYWKPKSLDERAVQDLT